jgi:hypothetical protein
MLSLDGDGGVGDVNVNGIAQVLRVVGWCGLISVQW